MPSPYDIQFDGAEPLDLSGLTQQQPQADPKAGRKQWLKLLPMIAAAAKGGPGAVEGLLAGFQRAQQAKAQQGQQAFQNQRLITGDQRAQQAQQFSQQHQRDTLNRQQEQDRSALVQEFSRALLNENLTDPEAVRALTDLYESRGAAMGMRPGTFQTTAMQVVKPNMLQQRKVQQRWNSMSAQDKQLAQQTQASLKIGDQVIPFDQWSAVVGGIVDPKTGAFPQAPTKPDVPSTPEESFYQTYATERGKKAFGELSTTEQAAARKMWLQSDDKPTDPVLAAIRALQLQQQQTAAAPGTLTKDQITYRNALADDYRTDSKDYVARISAMQSIRSSLSQGTAAGDMAGVFAFMKSLDPGSTVREGEYANAQNAAGVPEIVRNWYNQAKDGTILSPKQRADFMNTAIRQFKDAQERQRGLMQEYTDRATRGGINPADVVMDFDARYKVDTTLPNMSGGGAAPSGASGAKPSVTVGSTYNHPQLGRVRVVGTNPDGTVKVEKVP